MDVNVEEGRSSLPLPPDRTVPDRWEPRQIESSSGSSELSKQSSKEFGLGVTESTSREWTDEKHNLYLKSMEASFVKQLHNNEYPSIDMLGWHSEDSLQNPNSSLLANANNGTHSRQFKVLQGGCWKKINYDRAQTKLDIGDRVLQDNQWIRRFRSAGKCQEVPFPNVLENDALSTEPMHPGEQDPETCGLMKSQKPTTSGRATSSKKLLPFYSCHQDYFASTTEASDQNFVDDDHEQTQISNPTRKKKMKKAINDVVVKDEDSGS